MQRQLFLEWLTDFHHNEYVSWSQEGNVYIGDDWKFDRHLAMVLRCGDKERVLWARRRPWVSTCSTHGSWPVFSQAHYGLLLPLLLVQGQVRPWFNLAACNFHEDIKRKSAHRSPVLGSWWNCVLGSLALQLSRVASEALVPQIFVARDWSLSAFFAAFRIDPRGEWVKGFLSDKTQRTIRRVSSL